jgi:hypothetical protein
MAARGLVTPAARLFMRAGSGAARSCRQIRRRAILDSAVRAECEGNGAGCTINAAADRIAEPPGTSW